MPNQDAYFVPAGNHRFLLLDGLRGVAAIFVLVFHASTVLSTGRFTPSRLAPRGFLAVDLFFVLSGFVIAFSYENRLRGALKFGTFVVARFIRLYPIFFLGIALGVVLDLVLTHLAHSAGTGPSFLGSSLLCFLFIPDLFHARASPLFPMNIPAWSLFFEVVANLVYAALVYFRVAKTKILLPLSLISLASLAIWVFKVSGNVDGGSSADTLWVGLVRVGWSFFAGVLIHRFLLKNKKPLFSNRVGWMSAAAILLVVVAVFSTPMTQTALAQMLTITLVFPAIVYFGARTSLPRQTSRLSSFLGDVSYPMYLIHIPLLSIFEGRTYLRLIATHAVVPKLALPVFVIVVVFLSWWLGVRYDRPVRKLLTARYNQLLASG